MFSRLVTLVLVPGFVFAQTSPKEFYQQMIDSPVVTSAEKLDADLAEINSVTLLQIAKLGRRELRRAFRKFSTRIDERTSGTVEGSGNIRSSSRALWLLGVGGSNTRGSFELSGQTTEAVANEIYHFTLVDEVQLDTVSKSASIQIHANPNLKVDPRTTEIIKEIRQKFRGRMRTADFHELITKKRDLFALLLDELELRERSDFSDTQQAELDRLLEWAQTTKVTAEVLTMTDYVAKRIKLFDKKKEVYSPAGEVLLFGYVEDGETYLHIRSTPEKSYPYRWYSRGFFLPEFRGTRNSGEGSRIVGREYSESPYTVQEGPKSMFFSRRFFNYLY